MARREQVSRQPSSRTADHHPAAPAPDEQAQLRKQQTDEGIDALLDEIDETLERNAAEFVRDYIQKGGQ